MSSFGSRLSGPLKIGLIIGLLGALLTILGLLFGDFAPLTLRTLLLGILLGGGSWGLVSWAIASAAVDATGSAAADEAEPEAVEAGAAATEPAPVTDQKSG